jgi:hypothetical protein
MTFDWINKAVISPIFFFLFVLLGLLTMGALYAALMKSTSFIVVALILFLLSFNAFRLGWRMYNEQS